MFTLDVAVRLQAHRFVIGYVPNQHQQLSGAQDSADVVVAMIAHNLISIIELGSTIKDRRMPHS